MIKCNSCSAKIRTSESFDATKKFRCPRCKTLLKVSSFDPESTTIVKDVDPIPPPIVALNSQQKANQKSITKIDNIWMPLILLLAFTAGVMVTAIAMQWTRGIVVGTDPAGLAHSLEVSSRVVDRPVIFGNVCLFISSSVEKHFGHLLDRLHVGACRPFFSFWFSSHLIPLTS